MSKPSDSKRACPGNTKKVTSPMVVPNNESKVCEAVIRVLEKWTGETHADVRHPDKEGSDPPVDMRLKLGTQEYAIEHTRIEPYQNQIETDVVVNRIIHHIRKNIPHPFPGPAYYELQFPIDVSFPRGKARRDRALKDLVEWVRAKEQILHDRNSDGSSRCATPTWPTIQSGAPRQDSIANSICCAGRLRGSYE